VAGLVSAAPVAVKEKVVVPGVFKMNGIPLELSGLPLRVIGCPFCVRLTALEFCVCQLTITVLPCCTVRALAVMVMVGCAGADGGVAGGVEDGAGAGEGETAKGWPEPPHPANSAVNNDASVIAPKQPRNGFFAHVRYRILQT
jgi:hypothetical protein